MYLNHSKYKDGSYLKLIYTEGKFLYWAKAAQAVLLDLNIDYLQ